jgi:hypothetical protein
MTLRSPLNRRGNSNEGLSQAANTFAHTYWVAFALGATVVAALFLPRKRGIALLDHQNPGHSGNRALKASLIGLRPMQKVRRTRRRRFVAAPTLRYGLSSRRA